MDIKKGDTVKILAGKDRGKTGTVMKIFPSEERASVEGINVYVKRVRPRRANQKGEIVNVPRPLHASNIALVCTACKQPTRIGRREEGGRRVRYCRKCNAST